MRLDAISSPCSRPLRLVLVLGTAVLAACSAAPEGLDGSGGAVSPGSEDDGIRLQRETFLMGTRLRIRVAAGERSEAIQAGEAVFRRVRRAEARLSTWEPDTELGRLNRASVGKPRSLSREVLALLREIDRWSRETGGAFDPRIGALVDVWELRGPGRLPGCGELERALAASGPEGIRLDFASGTATRLDPAAWIDAGGFGKGAALRAASRTLRERGIGSALLDFGGQVVALGESGDGEGGWRVALAHPRQRGETVGWLELSGVSAATSGASERRVSVGDRTLGHVIDPRTGRPAPDWGSATVVAPDPLTADVLSTALFVLGPQEGMEWARTRDDVGVLFLVSAEEGDVRYRWNRKMEEWWDGVPDTDAPEGAHGPFPAGRDEATKDATVNSQQRK